MSGSVAALLELVKNAYDADASVVTIGFGSEGDSRVTRLSVSDDGHGLSLADIREKWMEPATVEKVSRRTSPKGRRMLGSKGIGRFAAARIGHRMTLRSTTHSGRKTKSAQVTVDWKQFDDGYLDEKFLELLPTRDDGVTAGTSIEITELRDDWGGELLTKAVRELRRLSSPRSGKDGCPFRVQIDTSPLGAEHPASKRVSSLLLSGEGKMLKEGPVEIPPFPFIKAADYEVEGRFDAKGTFSGEMRFNRSGQKTVQQLRFRVPLDAEMEEESCGPVSVRLHIIDRETESLKSLIRRIRKRNQPGGTPADLRKILDDTVGVAIYRDGFRIRPYGDNDQDWLTLDKRRVQNPTKHIGHNQVIGTVTIGSETESNLVEKSSREGLEENASYHRLVRLLTELLAREVEERRRSYRMRLGIGVRKPKSFSQAHQAALLKDLEEAVAFLPKGHRDRVQKDVAEARRKIASALNDIEERQTRLEAGATLGLIVSEVLHEGRQPVTFIVSASKHALRTWPFIFEESLEAKRKREDLAEDLAGMEREAKRLERLFRLLIPISGRRRGRPSDYQVNEVVESTVTLFKERIEDGGTEIINRCVPCASHGYRDDLAAALTNLLDNSLFWLGHLKVRNPEIRITSTQSGEGVVLEVSDNGPGVSEDLCDRLFEPGFSTKSGGTGLGLSIARQALERSGGLISYVNQKKGSTFRITLPGGKS